MTTLPCPSCDAPLARRVVQEPTNLWSMWQCQECGAYPVTSLLKPERHLYTEDYFEQQTVDSPRYSGYLSYDRYRPHLIEEFQARLRPILQPSMKMLDIGCATGAALEAARMLGIPERQLTGVDISKYAIEKAKRIFPQATCVCDDVDRVHFSERFDVITLWDVLEHVPHPAQTFALAASWLAPGGTLLLSTPNPESVIRAITGRFWSEFRSGEHLCFVSPAWCRWIASRTGLEVRTITRPTKRMTLEHLSSRMRAYIPFFPSLRSQRVILLTARDQLYASFVRESHSV